MAKKAFPLTKAYQLIEPGPVVMVTTFHQGKANIMTMSWHMMIDFIPPIMGCVISEQNYSFKNIHATKECVINIPTVELAPQVVAVGTSSGSKIDKFKEFHLTQEAASQVNVPMIGECYANLECKVIDIHMAAKYNMFILEVLAAWIKPSTRRPRTIHHCGNGVFVVDGNIIKFPSIHDEPT